MMTARQIVTVGVLVATVVFVIGILEPVWADALAAGAGASFALWVGGLRNNG